MLVDGELCSAAALRITTRRCSSTMATGVACRGLLPLAGPPGRRVELEHIAVNERVQQASWGETGAASDSLPEPARYRRPTATRRTRALTTSAVEKLIKDYGLPELSNTSSRVEVDISRPSNY